MPTSPVVAPPPSSLSRRRALHAAAAAITAPAGISALLSGCTMRRPAPSSPTVTLYSSVDSAFLKLVVDAFQAETGLRCLTVGDTEATKTFGLVNRLLAERDRPRADVWWSSEPFGTIRLASEGVLEPYTSPAEARVFPETGRWPDHLRDRNRTWYGFGQRGRVLGYAADRAPTAATIRSIGVLPHCGLRLGLARPAFGTTRGHLACLTDRFGPDLVRNWLADLKAAGLRLYDGNAAVVRAIHLGEIDAGLTDSDDVWAAQAQGWPVNAHWIGNTLGPAGSEGNPTSTQSPVAPGPLLLPNTVALVRNGPQPDPARRLVDWLIGGRAEELLAASDSRNIPIKPDLASAFERDFPQFWVQSPVPVWQPDLEAAYAAMEEAMAVADQVFGA